MKTSIVKKLVSKIKNIMAKLKDKKLNAINNQNNFNEEHEDIINENIYNERLEASLGYLVATSASCPPQMLTFLLEDGLSISFNSGCQASKLRSRRCRQSSRYYSAAAVPATILSETGQDPILTLEPLSHGKRSEVMTSHP